MSTIKTLGTAAAIIILTAYAANAGSIELMATGESSTSDIKANGTIPGGIGFFTRNRQTLDYDSETVNPFSVIDVSYPLPLGDGFDALVEGQFTAGDSPDKRFGIQYFKKFGEEGKTGSAYALVSKRFAMDPNTEIVVKGTYTPTLIGDLTLLTQWESALNLNGSDRNYAVQRVRAGLGYKGLSGGIGVDVSTSAEGETEAGIGGFVSTSF